MDKYDLPKRIKRELDTVSLDEMLATESINELSDEIGLPERLLYEGMSRNEYDKGNEFQELNFDDN